jgi:hypothetical protein
MKLEQTPVLEHRKFVTRRNYADWTEKQTMQNVLSLHLCYVTCLHKFSFRRTRTDRRTT